MFSAQRNLQSWVEPTASCRPERFEEELFCLPMTVGHSLLICEGKAWIKTLSFAKQLAGWASWKPSCNYNPSAITALSCKINYPSPSVGPCVLSELTKQTTSSFSRYLGPAGETKGTSGRHCLSPPLLCHFLPSIIFSPLVS